MTNALVFNHDTVVGQMKVGANFEDDYRRASLIRSIIDNPKSFPEDYSQPSARSLEGKNAGPMGCVLMMDANQVRPVILLGNGC